MKLKVKVGDRFFDVEVEDLRTRPIRAIVDDEIFEVWPESKAAYTVGAAIRPSGSPGKVSPPAATTAPAAQPYKPGSSSREETNSKSVRAPIPGVITALSIHPGDEVTLGQELCKLEAMKMNNSIRANRAGKIERIQVSVGQQVKHNDLLMEYAD